MVGTPSAWLSCFVSVIECKSVVAVTSMLLSEVIAELYHFVEYLLDLQRFHLFEKVVEVWLKNDAWTIAIAIVPDQATD